MARDLNGTTDHLLINTGVVTAAPFTMACWALPDGLSGSDNLMVLNATGSSSNYFGIAFIAAAIVQYINDGSGNVNNTASTSASVGAWQHICAVFASATSRTVYHNGGGAATNTTSRTPTGINRTTLGAFRFNLAADLFDGKFAEGAIWDAELSAAEVAILALGVSPTQIRPGSLVAYWPLIGRYSPEIDIVGRSELTLAGTPPPAIAHKNMYYPRRRSRHGVFTEPAAGTILPQMMQHYYVGLS